VQIIDIYFVAIAHSLQKGRYFVTALWLISLFPTATEGVLSGKIRHYLK